MDHDGGIRPARCNGCHEGYVWDTGCTKRSIWVTLSWIFAVVDRTLLFLLLVRGTSELFEKSLFFQGRIGR